MPSYVFGLRHMERADTPELKLCHMFAKWIERVGKKSGRNIRASRRQSVFKQKSRYNLRSYNTPNLGIQHHAKYSLAFGFPHLQLALRVVPTADDQVVSGLLGAVAQIWARRPCAN